jgi:hypothetical protein
MIGLASLIVLAIGSMYASAAQAEPTFSSEVGETYLLGSAASVQEFTTNAGEIDCAAATVEGTLLGTEATTTTVHPTYGSCTAFGFVAVSIDTKACEFELVASEVVSIVNCPTTEPITITIPLAGCNIKIANQGTFNGIAYTNQGSGSTASVLVTAGLSGITYTSSGGLCGAAGSSSNGTYVGSNLVEGFQDAAHTEQVGIQVLAVAAKPKFGVFIKPPGLNFNVNESKKVKVEDEGAAGEDWTLDGVLLVEEIGKKEFWELSEAANCQNKAVEGGKGFNCEVNVKCKKAGAIAYVVVLWSTPKAKNQSTYFGPLKC